MSGSDDYLDEMKFNDTTDQGIERLFDGSLDSLSDLAPIADLFASVRAEASVDLDEQTMASFIQSASATATTAARQRDAEGEATSPTHLRRAGNGSLLASLRHRVAAVSVAAAMFVSGMTGMAVAADHAKPGDTLYGVDRALEAVGIGNGNADERLAEVQALFDSGEVPRGLSHAADLVEAYRPDNQAASIALQEAADRVKSGGSEQSAATRELVAGLLSHLSRGAQEFDGLQIADIARTIGRPDNLPSSNPPSDPGPPESHQVEPPGRSGSAPGQSTPPGNRP